MEHTATVEAKCFTRRGALRKADRLNKRKKRLREQGRSSGWGRFDYGIRRAHDLSGALNLRHWHVICR